MYENLIRMLQRIQNDRDVPRRHQATIREAVSELRTAGEAFTDMYGLIRKEVTGGKPEIEESKLTPRSCSECRWCSLRKTLQSHELTIHCGAMDQQVGTISAITEEREVPEVPAELFRLTREIATSCPEFRQANQTRRFHP